MDIKLKDLLGCISTGQRIKILNIDNGEQFCPMYGDLQNLNDFFVTELFTYKNDGLMIHIKESI